MSGEERARSGRGVSTSQGAPPGWAPCKSPRTHTSRSPGAGRAGEGDTEAGCREAGTNKGPGTVHQVRGSTSDTLQTQNGSGPALSQVTLSVEAAAAAAAAAAAIQHDLDQIQRSGAQSSGKSVRDESEGHWHGGHGDQQPQPPLQQQRAWGVTSAHASAGAAISGGGVQAGGAGQPAGCNHGAAQQHPLPSHSRSSSGHRHGHDPPSRAGRVPGSQHLPAHSGSASQAPPSQHPPGDDDQPRLPQKLMVLFPCPCGPCTWTVRVNVQSVATPAQRALPPVQLAQMPGLLALCAAMRTIEGQSVRSSVRRHVLSAHSDSEFVCLDTLACPLACRRCHAAPER